MLPVYAAGEAESYFQSKSLRFRRSGDELLLEHCPWCSGEWKAYVNNQSGLFSCKRGSCNKSANFWQIKKHFGDVAVVEPSAGLKPKKTYTLVDFEPFEAALAGDADAQAYLAERGLSLETAQAWHFGLKTDRDNVRWLMMPYVRNHDVLDVKYRSLPPTEKRFKRLGGGESVLYGQHTMDAFRGQEDRPLYIAEAETDAVTLWQQGFRPCIATTTGAGAFNPAWYDAIQDYAPTKIYICYDSDAAGQNGAERHVKKFEADGRSVVNIVLPTKDVNEFFQSQSVVDFQKLLDDAKPQEIENAKHISSVIDLLEEQLWYSANNFDGQPSQFESLNTMIAGGYWNGQLVTLSAPSGCGKTTLVLGELLWQAKRGSPAFLYCLEMPVTMMLRKIISKEFDVPMLKITQAHIAEYRASLTKLPFYMGDKAGDLDDVERTIRAAHKRYDLGCIAFDNLNYFVRSVDNNESEIARVTKRMKELAVDLHVPIILIAQPRKFDDETRAMRKGDLKGSSAIEADSDTIILLHRRRVQTEVKNFGKDTRGFLGNQSPYTLVRVDKSRYCAGGETYLYLDGAKSTYRELTPGEHADGVIKES